MDDRFQHADGTERPVQSHADKASGPAPAHPAGVQSDDQQKPRQLSLSAGPPPNPRPNSRPRQAQQLLCGALAVAAIGLLLPVLMPERPASATCAGATSGALMPVMAACYTQQLGAFLVALALLFWAGKVVAEERLSVVAHRKLVHQLEDSFKHPATAADAWMRVWIGQTTIGFSAVAVSPAPSPGNAESAGGGEGARPSGAAVRVLAMDWVLLRLRLVSFMPWSNVRRIPHVRVGGMSVHITEALSSNNTNSSSSIRNASSADLSRDAGGASSSKSVRGGSEVGGSAGDGSHRGGTAGHSRLGAVRLGDGDAELGNQESGIDPNDSWSRHGRPVSLSRTSPAGSGGDDWGGDGYGWERVAQASLESEVLGHEFAAKYKMYTEEASNIIRSLSKIFFNLMKRYVVGEVLFEDLSIHLSPDVWRDLACSALQWEGASVVRDLLPARGVEFHFDVSLSARDMGCNSGSRTALEIVTAVTKRTMLQLGRVMMWEARRVFFNRESVVEIFVNSLLLGGEGSTTPVRVGGQSTAAAPDATAATNEGVTLVTVLGKGVSAVAKRKGVSQLLTVLKHALFKAITIAAGGADPDLCNQPLAALLSHSEIGDGFDWTDGDSSSTVLRPVSGAGEGEGCDKSPEALAITDPGIASGGSRSGRRRSGRFGGVRPVQSRGFRDVEGEAIAVAAKISQMVRGKDLVEALHVLHAIQVGPFLKELALYTKVGPTLRRLKIDVDYIISSAGAHTIGTLLEKVLGQLDIAGFKGTKQLKRLQGRASRDINRLRERAGKASSSVGSGPSLELQEVAILAYPPESMEDIRNIAALAAKVARSFTAELTPEDVKAISTALSVIQGIRKRRAVAAAAVAAAEAAAAESNDGDYHWSAREESREGAWNLENEVELLSKDSEAAESLRHAMKRLEELTKAGGVYMDVYLVLSVLEFAFGGLLQRLPKLLPVVQTTIKKKGFIIKISNLNLAGIVFPRSEIRLSFRGTSLPPLGSIVETNTPFGLGRVVRYKKRTHSLCVELLSLPLRTGRHKYARAFIPPGAAVVVYLDQENAIGTKPATAGTAPNTSSDARSAATSPTPSGPATSIQALAATKTPFASSIQQRRQERRSRSRSSIDARARQQHQRPRSEEFFVQTAEHSDGRRKSCGGFLSPRSERPSQAGTRLADIFTDPDRSGGTGTPEALACGAEGNRDGAANPDSYAEGTTGIIESGAKAGVEAGARKHMRWDTVPESLGAASSTVSAAAALLDGGIAGARRRRSESSRGSKQISPVVSPLPPRPARPVSLQQGFDATADSESTPGHTWPRSGGGIESRNDRDAAGAGDGGSGSGEGWGSSGSIRGNSRGRRSFRGKGSGIMGGRRGWLSSEGSGSVLERVVGSGRETWKKATSAAAATLGAGDAIRGTPWASNVAGGSARGKDKGGKRRSSRGQAAQEDARAPQAEPVGPDAGAAERVRDGEVINEKPPFLSFTVGGVNGYLPDVHWSVEMQQKRFLRVEDSGSVKVWLEGISLSVSLDLGAGPSSLPPISCSFPSPVSSAAPSSVPGDRADIPWSASSSPERQREVEMSGEETESDEDAVKDVGGTERPRWTGSDVDGAAWSFGATDIGDPSAPLACTPGGGLTSTSVGRAAVPTAADGEGGDGDGVSGRGASDSTAASSGGAATLDGGGPALKWSKIKSKALDFAKATGRAKRRPKAFETATTFFQPISSWSAKSIDATPSPPAAPAATSAATETAPQSTSPTSPMAPSMVFSSPSQFCSTGRTGGGGNEEGGDAGGASSVASEWGEDEDGPCCSIGFGSSGLLKVTACHCTVGSIRIEVGGSKHDGIYNFLAKGLGETIRDAVREAVEKAFSEEIGLLVEFINDNVTELWSGQRPKSKKLGRVVCSAIRAQGVGRGKIEPYVKVRLFQDGAQLMKKSTAAFTTVAAASVAGERESSGRNPCWLGLDNEMMLDLPKGDAAEFSLVFEVWHCGTLASNLVGSTRRVTLPEIEAIAAERRDESPAQEAESWWWDIDTGGKLMVKLALFGATPRRRKSASRAGSADATERPVARFGDGDSSRTLRRWTDGARPE